jgi:serine phosphatase RsbU (regulator of sigma subunit)
MLDVDGGVRRRFASNNLPMGIVREVAGTGVERFNWDQPCRLVMLSDGVLEMSGPGDEQFGSERLVAALAEAPSTDLVSHLHSVLLAHAAGEAAHDDMSILVVDCRIADRQA